MLPPSRTRAAGVVASPSASDEDGFRSRAPWWGPDLQTLRNFLRPPRPSFTGVSARRIEIALSDGSGDALSVMLQRPPGGGRGPLVVLVHGLSGCEESAYLQTSASGLLARGHPVARVNLRGAGPSGPLCRDGYHAGRTSDLHDVFQALAAEAGASSLFAVGYSLGGGLLLKLLAECGERPLVSGAATVSAPIDLAAAARRMRARRNAAYQRYLLRRLRRETARPGAELSAAERRAVAEARSIYEFDHRFVAPHHGYAGADHYYEENAAKRFLPAVRVPTLVIHALDDPWIPAEAYARFPWRRHRFLRPLLPKAGGHVGFHARGDRTPWHDRRLHDFLAQLAPGPGPERPMPS
jgi:predicted alpha/beta-fold hydrolase